MDGAGFQVLCEDQSGRGTVGEVIDMTVAAPFINNRRIVGGRDRAGDALSPLSSRFDEAKVIVVADCCGAWVVRSKVSLPGETSTTMSPPTYSCLPGSGERSIALETCVVSVAAP